VAEASTLPAPPDEQHLRRRRLGYLAITVLLVAIVGSAAVDALGRVAIFGVDTAEVRATGGGYVLEVRYAEVSRPALATPLEIRVHRAGGFDGPITLALDHEYVKLWDENGIYPSPSAETSDGRDVIWEFDPPEGDTLRVVYDARIEPAAQSGRDGHVELLEDDLPVVAVDFHTRIWP
jgi:hypothetical protein